MAKKKKNPEKKRAKYSVKKWLCFAVALFLFSALISIFVTAKSEEQTRAAQFVRSLLTPRGEVADGTLQMFEADAFEIPEGEIGYYLNKKMVFPDGYSKGDVLMQNPEQCGYVLRLRVYLADGSSNKPIYTSPKLSPGQYISGDKLNHYLPSGTYDCTFTVTAYDLEDGSEQGFRSGFLTVSVMS